MGCAAHFPPQPQTIEVYERSGDSVRAAWIVDGKKLKGNDRIAVSPQFSFRGAQFRIMLQSKKCSDSKGGSCFRKAQGRGTLQLKCESNIQGATFAPVKIIFAVGSSKRSLDDTRGPVVHDFSRSGLVGLPRQEEVWDFS